MKEDLLYGKLLFPFIAPPNGGKGTQTIALTKFFGMPKIDMGGMLREIGKEETELARKVRERQDNGRLVETSIVLQVLTAGLTKLAQENPTVKGFILDGFPRNIEQVEGLLDLCREQGAIIAKAFYLKVPDEVILRRAVSRRLCPVGGEIYNLLTKPPAHDETCDLHHVSLIHRVDDEPEKVKERLRSFEEETRPVLARFRETGYLIKIDGNRPEAEVTEELIEQMKPFLTEEPLPA